MYVLARSRFNLTMHQRTRLLVADAPVTRIGRLVLAGQVIDDEPVMPANLRVMDPYVLSAVFAGRGVYEDAEGTQPIRPGTVTVVRPGVPHRYATAPGERWTEVFAVFDGPLFEALDAAGALPEAGPQHPSPTPAMAALQTVLRMTPSGRLGAEHQLMALADWLLDAGRSEPGASLTAPVQSAVERLSGTLDAPVDLRALAAEVGLSYDAFRRRFSAEVGRSPLAFRNDRRLAAAATLLRHTDLTNGAVARALGYVDEFHFSRRFRAHHGVPPGRYRRR